jgi:hypothetical protein
MITFITKFKNWFLAGIIILTIGGLFIGGFLAGKSHQKDEDLKSIETSLKIDVKKQQGIIASSETNASILIDSSGIYEEMAARQSVVVEKDNITIKNKSNEIKTNIAHVDALSNDSNMVLFTKLAEQYSSDTAN